MKASGLKLRSFYPIWVWHSEPTKYCARHHILRLSYSAKRRAAKLHASPAWADQKAIRVIYAKAKEIQRMTGQRMEVDHIVPLKGKNVCGFHVESNLQILTRTENDKKSNKFKDEDAV